MRQRHVVSRAEEVRALRTPGRYQVLSGVQALGRCSVKDLAAHLGRNAVSLYYHLNALERAGLVRTVRPPGGGRSAVRLYEPAARSLIIDPRQRSEDFLAALRDAYHAVLRASARHLDRALESERERRGPRRNTMVLESRLRLAPRDRDALRARIQGLHRYAARLGARGGREDYYLVSVCTKINEPAIE